jgi:uncharacterized lipoprotein YajG
MKIQTANSIMIMIVTLLAMTFLVGCENNSSDQSNSTNSASAITNGAGTNLPATTNH